MLSCNACISGCCSRRGLAKPDEKTAANLQPTCVVWPCCLCVIAVWSKCLFALVKVVLQFVVSGRSIQLKRWAVYFASKICRKWNKEARYNNGQFSHHPLLQLLNHIIKEKQVEFLHKWIRKLIWLEYISKLCKGLPSPHCFLKATSRLPPLLEQPPEKCTYEDDRCCFVCSSCNKEKEAIIPQLYALSR